MTEESTVAEVPSLSFEGDKIKTYAGEDGVPLFEEADHKKIDALLEKFGGAGGQAKLAKGYMELESKLGKMTKPIDDKATDRDVADRRRFIASLLNIPETPDAYDLVDPEVPEGMEINQDFKNEAKLMAHKHHVSPEGLQAFYELHNRSQIENAERVKEHILKTAKDTAARIKAEVGADNFVARTELVQRYLKGFTQSEDEWNDFKKFAESEGGLISNNYLINKALGEAAETTIGEGSTIMDAARARLQQKSEREELFPNSPEMDK